MDERTFAGRLRVQDVGGEDLVREVSAGSCAEVAEALALIAAIVIRPDAAEDEGDHGPTPTAVPIAARRREVAESPPPGRSAGVASGSDWHIYLRSFVSIRGQILPTPLYGAALGPEIVIEGSSWQPAFGLAVGGTLLASAATDNVVPDSTMSGRLVSAQLFASPVRLRSGPMELRPYASIEAGGLFVSGQGNGLLAGGSSQEWWVSMGVFGQAALRLGGRWVISAQGGADVHPFRYTFQYVPLDVHRIGAIGLMGASSISFRLE